MGDRGKRGGEEDKRSKGRRKSKRNSQRDEREDMVKEPNQLNNVQSNILVTIESSPLVTSVTIL